MRTAPTRWACLLYTSFTTGLGTNLKELIKAGPIATLVACVGVAVPLVGGTLLYLSLIHI